MKHNIGTLQIMKIKWWASLIFSSHATFKMVQQYSLYVKFK